MRKRFAKSKFKRFTSRNKYRGTRYRRAPSLKKIKELKKYRLNRKNESKRLHLFKKFLPTLFIPRFISFFPSQFKSPVRRKRVNKKPLS
jgi:hypothetical protein